MPKDNIKGRSKKSRAQGSDKKDRKKRILDGEAEESDNVSVDMEDDEDYDEERDSEDDKFIAKDDEIEEELIEQQERERREIRRQEKLERRKQRRERENKSEDENLDDDDYALINENKANKRKLKKLQKQDSEEEIVEQPIIKKEPVIKKQIFDKNRQESTAADELDPNQALKDKFITEDIDDMFGTAQDQEICEKDIPERLQIKLQNRLNPTDKEIENESEWVFDVMMESLQQSRNQSFSSKIQDVKKKICKVLKFFRNESHDIPYITRYRFNEVDPELTQADCWRIFNLDIEYGKFLVQKKQCEDFFTKLAEFGNDLQMKTYKNQIFYTKTQRDLDDFQPLINFYKSYYQKELENVVINSGKKLPVQKKEFVFNARQQRLDEFSKRCMLGPIQLDENIQEERQIHKPPQPMNIGPNEMAKEYMRSDQQEPINVIKDMCVYTAIELSAQPGIRRGLKKHIQEHGWIVTQPTDKGNKELDVFNPCYRVKRVEQKISDFQNSDLFLDIIQNEQLGLITYNIVIRDDCTDERIGNRYLEKMLEMFKYPDDTTKWKFVRKEIFEIFTNNGSGANQDRGKNKCFLATVMNEIKNELKEDSENFVLQQCSQSYQSLINTGYFKIHEPQRREVTNDSRRLIEEDIIPQRERLVVMGAIMHQIDSRNYMTTIAVVNEYGDLLHHKDFLYLIPPRKPRQRNDGVAEEMRPAQIEEQKKHNEDKATFQNILREYNVSLISVSADCLEAKRLKKALGEMAKYFNDQQGDEDQEMPNAGDIQKEAFVIWGRPEVPKLFAQSHYSQKLLKNHPFILKKAISLARFEQDPMNEILNLWSPIMSENQALNLNLHHLQKHVNQARLADALEEVNIKTVNNIGIDINLLVEHDHLHNQLQFLSGLGPRKAQKYIQRLKQHGKPLYTRNEIYETKILKKYCFISSFGYTKVYVAPEKRPDDFNRTYNILDQTRIHYRNYDQVYKIVTDCVYEDVQEVDKAKKSQAVNDIIKNPDKLKQFAFGDYKEQIKKLDMNNIRQIFDQIIEDLCYPFKDPREALEIVRTPENLQFKNEDLFYCLIDETRRTFKQGMIVSATVQRVFMGERGNRITCRLENGMDGNIREENCEFFKNGASTVDMGSIITGRIYDIYFDGVKENPDIKFDDNFSVNLVCDKNDLSNHKIFFEKKGISYDHIHAEDLQNQSFKSQEEHNLNQQKPQIQKRKIQHQRFQNISSTNALQFLKKEDNGEFYFRPSSQGPDHLTLTWKFYEENIVHIDIREHDKPIGANIGSKLQISDEYYENLQEIVERYITPCNRSVREILQHPKFLKCNGDEDLQKALEQEKQEDNSRIPYRFTISPKYPQYVIMGYIPKNKMVREFLKVKPRGYFFHQQYHYPFQNMINWFKQEFRTRDYQNFLRKAQSPKQMIGRQIQKQPENPSNMAMRKHGGGMDIQQDNAWGADAGGFKQEQNDGYSSRQKYGDSKGGGYGRGNRPPRQNSPERNNNTAGGWGQDSQSNVKDERERRNDWGSGDAGGNAWGGGDVNMSSPQSDRGGGRGRGGGNRSPMKCFNCQGEGHMSRDCTEPKKPRDGGGGGGRGPMKCFNCQGEGHMSRECPEPRKPRDDGGGGGGRGPMKCYNCQGEGHMSRECPEPRKPRDRDNNEGGGYKRRRNEDDGGGGWNNNDKDGGDGGWGAGATNGHQPNDQWGAQEEPQQNGGWGDKKESHAETAGGWGEQKQSSQNNDGGQWGADKNSQNSGGGGWGN